MQTHQQLLHSFLKNSSDCSVTRLREVGRSDLITTDATRPNLSGF
jgi:hypothetical protein